jgi:hypothetical protein
MIVGADEPAWNEETRGPFVAPGQLRVLARAHWQDAPGRAHMLIIVLYGDYASRGVERVWSIMSVSAHEMWRLKFLTVKKRWLIAETGEVVM